MNTKRRDLAVRMEEHEATVWAECVTAASELPGNPLSAVVDRSGRVPLVALCAIDRSDLNRVVALGVRAPARPEDLDAIWAFYDANRQRNFRIDVTPLARPSELAEWIAARGMVCTTPGTFKIWRSVETQFASPPNVEVRRLGSADADAIAELNVIAWGAWNTPAIRDWFGATAGRAGCQHYGVLEAGRLVAAGALFVSDSLGWFGFDATHPRSQGKALRQAISATRLADAAMQGCRFIHAESAIPPPPRVFRDGWQLLYEKQNYSRMRVDEIRETG